MSTLFAPDRIPLLELDFGIAVPAEILRQAVPTFGGGAEEWEAAGVGGWWVVGFARHFFGFSVLLFFLEMLGFWCLPGGTIGVCVCVGGKED
jgi:hypothetical protein